MEVVLVPTAYYRDGEKEFLPERRLHLKEFDMGAVEKAIQEAYKPDDTIDDYEVDVYVYEDGEEWYVATYWVKTRDWTVNPPHEQESVHGIDYTAIRGE